MLSVRSDLCEGVDEVARRCDTKFGMAPKICIVGGAFRNADAAALIPMLAARISGVGQRAWVLTQGLPGVQQAFAQHFWPEGMLAHILPKGASSGFGRGIDFHAAASFKEAAEAFAQIGDIYVCIEADVAGAEVAQQAYRRGAFIIPLVRSGLATSGEQGFPREAFKKPASVAEETWLDLFNPGVSVDDTATAVASIILQHLEQLEQGDMYVLALIQALFEKFDTCGSGRLSCEAMFVFASQMCGFDRGRAQWNDEFSEVCQVRGWDPKVGVNLKEFQAFVSNRNNAGFCSTAELEALVEKHLGAQKLKAIQAQRLPAVRIGSALRRAAVVEKLFACLDSASTQVLDSQSIHRFARACGFQGSYQDWVKEWNALCNLYKWDRTKGVDKQAFETFVNDEESIGHCGDRELEEVVRKLGGTIDDVGASDLSALIFHMMDNNKDGYISQEEWASVMNTAYPDGRHLRARDLFKQVACGTQPGSVMRDFGAQAFDDPKSIACQVTSLSQLSDRSVEERMVAYQDVVGGRKVSKLAQTSGGSCQASALAQTSEGPLRTGEHAPPTGGQPDEEFLRQLRRGPHPLRPTASIVSAIASGADPQSEMMSVVAKAREETTRARIATSRLSEMLDKANRREQVANHRETSALEDRAAAGLSVNSQARTSGRESEANDRFEASLRDAVAKQLEEASSEAVAALQACQARIAALREKKATKPGAGNVMHKSFDNTSEHGDRQAINQAKTDRELMTSAGNLLTSARDDGTLEPILQSVAEFGSVREAMVRKQPTALNPVRIELIFDTLSLKGMSDEDKRLFQQELQSTLLYKGVAADHVGHMQIKLRHGSLIAALEGPLESLRHAKNARLHPLYVRGHLARILYIGKGLEDEEKFGAVASNRAQISTKRASSEVPIAQVLEEVDCEEEDDEERRALKANLLKFSNVTVDGASGVHACEDDVVDETPQADIKDVISPPPRSVSVTGAPIRSALASGDKSSGWYKLRRVTSEIRWADCPDAPSKAKDEHDWQRSGSSVVWDAVTASVRETLAARAANHEHDELEVAAATAEIEAASLEAAATAAQRRLEERRETLAQARALRDRHEAAAASQQRVVPSVAEAPPNVEAALAEHARARAMVEQSDVERLEQEHEDLSARAEIARLRAHLAAARAAVVINRARAASEDTAAEEARRTAARARGDIAETRAKSEQARVEAERSAETVQSLMVKADALQRLTETAPPTQRERAILDLAEMEHRRASAERTRLLRESERGDFDKAAAKAMLEAEEHSKRADEHVAAAHAARDEAERAEQRSTSLTEELSARLQYQEKQALGKREREDVATFEAKAPEEEAASKERARLEGIERQLAMDLGRLQAAAEASMAKQRDLEHAEQVAECARLGTERGRECSGGEADFEQEQARESRDMVAMDADIVALGSKAAEARAAVDCLDAEQRRIALALMPQQLEAELERARIREVEEQAALRQVDAAQAQKTREAKRQRRTLQEHERELVRKCAAEEQAKLQAAEAEREARRLATVAEEARFTAELQDGDERDRSLRNARQAQASSEAAWRRSVVRSKAADRFAAEVRELREKLAALEGEAQRAEAEVVNARARAEEARRNAASAIRTGRCTSLDALESVAHQADRRVSASRGGDVHHPRIFGMLEEEKAVERANAEAVEADRRLQEEQAAFDKKQFDAKVAQHKADDMERDAERHAILAAAARLQATALDGRSRDTTLHDAESEDERHGVSRRTSILMHDQAVRFMADCKDLEQRVKHAEQAANRARVGVADAQAKAEVARRRVEANAEAERARAIANLQETAQGDLDATLSRLDAERSRLQAIEEAARLRASEQLALQRALEAFLDDAERRRNSWKVAVATGTTAYEEARHRAEADMREANSLRVEADMLRRRAQAAATSSAEDAWRLAEQARNAHEEATGRSVAAFAEAQRLHEEVVSARRHLVEEDSAVIILRQEADEAQARAAIATEEHRLCDEALQCIRTQLELDMELSKVERSHFNETAVAKANEAKALDMLIAYRDGALRAADSRRRQATEEAEATRHNAFRDRLFQQALQEQEIADWHSSLAAESLHGSPEAKADLARGEALREVAKEEDARTKQSQLAEQRRGEALRAEAIAMEHGAKAQAAADQAEEWERKALEAKASACEAAVAARLAMRRANAAVGVAEALKARGARSLRAEQLACLRPVEMSSLSQATVTPGTAAAAALAESLARALTSADNDVCADLDLDEVGNAIRSALVDVQFEGSAASAALAHELALEAQEEEDAEPEEEDYEEEEEEEEEEEARTKAEEPRPAAFADPRPTMQEGEKTEAARPLLDKVAAGIVHVQTVGGSESPIRDGSIGTMLRDIATAYEVETAEADKRMRALELQLEAAKAEEIARRGLGHSETAIRLQVARRTHTLLAKMQTPEFREIRQAAQDAAARCHDTKASS